MKKIPRHLFCPFCGEPKLISVDKNGQYGTLRCDTCDKEFRFKLKEPGLAEND